MEKPRQAGLRYETDNGVLTSSQRRWNYWEEVIGATNGRVTFIRDAFVAYEAVLLKNTTVRNPLRWAGGAVFLREILR